MNRVRFIIATGIIGAFCWLSWWVVPPMACFTCRCPIHLFPKMGMHLFFFKKETCNRAGVGGGHSFWNEELFIAAQEREAFTEKTLKKMQIINTETRSMQEEISQEKQDIFTMKVTAEAELEAAAGFRKQAVS